MQSDTIRTIIEDVKLSPETREYIESLIGEEGKVDEKTVDLITQVLEDEAKMYQELAELASEEADIYDDLAQELDVINDEAELEIETANAAAYEEAAKSLQAILKSDPSQPAAWAQ